ncbi:hypothetical protein E2562_000871 [Oryza meyeriana var. granulata]|uniref:Uncharacterized protein n=1 Tax=Oryza meyeriana var. granulata TaxID=110450 RepID=A0A6G1CYR7_9ORYZ|nr:hypothetical protein E2562_000871 [Oryza meyeriana var. granulata]
MDEVMKNTRAGTFHQRTGTRCEWRIGSQRSAPTRLPVVSEDGKIARNHHLYRSQILCLQ